MGEDDPHFAVNLVPKGIVLSLFASPAMYSLRVGWSALSDTGFWELRGEGVVSGRSFCPDAINKGFTT